MKSCYEILPDLNEKDFPLRDKLYNATVTREAIALMVCFLLTLMGLYMWTAKMFRKYYRIMAAACLIEAHFYCLEGRDLWGLPIRNCLKQAITDP